MIQAYYTKYQTAKLIERILHATYNFPSRALPTLDLCSGLGALSAPYVSSLTQIHLVEMNEEALLEALEDHEQAKGWALMAEEWALTYAKANAYETTFCNPPFGKRAGRTKLDELGVELHWPELAYSESYFLRLAAAVTKKRLVFILPASALKDTPETRLVLGELETRGFCPTHIYELPVDGFEGATVKTHLWIFERTKTPYQWVDAICTTPRESFPAPVQAVRRSFSHPYGPIEGYALKDGTSSLQLTPQRFEEVSERPVDSSLWQPEPKTLGSLWTRMECVYELTALGWQPAQSQGYREGQAVDEAFEHALRAAEYMRQGAVHMAQTLASGLDTQELLERFGHLPQAGLLAYLPQGRPCKHAMSQDLKQLGLLQLLDPQDAHDQVIEGAWRLKRNRFLDQDAPVGLLAQLSLEQEPLSPELAQRLELELHALQIPTSRLELRASWIPKKLICEYLRKDLKVDQDSLYYGHPYPHDRDNLRLIGWLNYNKGPRRILEGDEALYHRKSAQFALFVQQEAERDELRRSIKLHWLAQYTPKRHVHLKREAQPSCIKLHPWQLEDQAFATSGQAFLNWDVGLGKTLGAISAAIQSHPGQAVFVVPKSVLDKWEREIHLAFPQTTVARIGMRQTRNSTWVNDYKLMPEQLIEACYRKPVKCLLMTHEAWARLSISLRHQRLLDADEASRLHQGSSKRETYTRELHLVRAAERNYLFGGVFNFEDLPLAQWLVVVDEAHQFKSLHAMPSGGWGSGLIRVGHCSESKRARDMHHKLKLLREQGGKSLGLSATPVTNSVVEIFNMLSIFAPEVLEKRGLENPQQFIDTYCELEELTTVSLAGAPISGQTIVGFRNLDDLKAMFAQCMSTRTAQDVGLELPQALEQFVQIEPTPKILDFIREQQSLLDDKILGQDQEKQDEEDDVHVFSILSAIDDVAAHPPLRAINGEHPKMEALLERVAQHQEHGGQLIFADRTESHEPLAQALVTRLGLKRQQIAILNGQTTSTSAARLKVQDAYNAGKLKVVIGGRMMSEGMDLQYDTCAIHFMNLSWEDNTIHQRKGRGVRQGNTQDEVQIYYYILKCSTDVYRQGTCTQKAGWFSALRSTQSEHMRISLFDDPIEPELIASLSAKPDEVLVQLREAKAQATLARLKDKIGRLSLQIVLRLHPQSRATQQPLLVQFERQLRQLPSLRDEDIDRVIQGLETLVAPYQGYRPSIDRWRDMWLASKKEDRPKLNLMDLIELTWDEEEHRPKLVAREEVSLQGPTTWITPGLVTAQVSSKAQARPFELIVLTQGATTQAPTPRPKPQFDVWSLSANTPVEKIEGTQLDLFAS